MVVKLPAYFVEIFGGLSIIVSRTFILERKTAIRQHKELCLVMLDKFQEV